MGDMSYDAIERACKEVAYYLNKDEMSLEEQMDMGFIEEDGMRECEEPDLFDIVVKDEYIDWAQVERLFSK